MSFFFFVYLYPIRIFQEVDIKDIDIYLRFQKIIRLFLLLGLLFSDIYYLFGGYNNITEMYGSLGITNLPVLFGFYPILFIFSSVCVLFLSIFLLKQKPNLEIIKGRVSARLVDVSSPIIDLIILVLLVLTGLMLGSLYSNIYSSPIFVQ